MKAAVFRSQNTMAVAELPIPTARPGEVVLKVHDCGICGSDLHAVQHGFGMPPESVMGHEFCGEIHQLGPAVKGFQIGERVTALPFFACGECASCRSGNGMRCPAIRSMGLGQMPGAYAEYVLCGATSLLKLPANVELARGRHGRAAVGRAARRQSVGTPARRRMRGDGGGADRPLDAAVV